MSEVAATAASKKRKYFDRGGAKNNRQKWSVINGRPKRGAPGVLLTCETGRERKCQREGIEILNHYHVSTEGAAPSGDGGSDEEGNGEGEDDATNTLSLEEELQLLKSKKGSSESSAFGVYETSCRGTIFVLCTLSNCNLIPTIQTEYMQSKKNIKNEITKSGSSNEISLENSNNNDNTDDVSNVSESDKKKGTSDNGAKDDDKLDGAPAINPSEDHKNIASTSLGQESPPWDPISTVQAIMSDIDNDCNKAAPASRFVTRMIPIQATCFASSEELQLTCLEVLKRYISRSTKTFAIVFKRRHCNNLDRNTVINIIGETMMKLFPDCKVELGKPQVTILVEVCGTLCGMSVVENFKDYRNFNLMGATPSLSKK